MNFPAKLVLLYSQCYQLEASKLKKMLTARIIKLMKMSNNHINSISLLRILYRILCSLSFAPMLLQRITAKVKIYIKTPPN